MDEFINLTPENLKTEHICCKICLKKESEGVLRKKSWLEEQFKFGHTFRKLNKKDATVFIEYAPLETALVPIIGENYLYIYCLWTLGQYRGKGYGKQLLDYAVLDAKKQGKSGLCVLGSKSKKTWLTNSDFFKANGFKVVDETKSGYELLALSFDDSFPKFSESAKNEQIQSLDLTIYYNDECPYVSKSVEIVKNFCNENKIPVNFIRVDDLFLAKNLPAVFNNFAVFYKGKFETVNLLDLAYLKRILKK